MSSILYLNILRETNTKNVKTKKIISISYIAEKKKSLFALRFSFYTLNSILFNFENSKKSCIE